MGASESDLDALPERLRAAAARLREHYDMRNHGVAAGAHALDDDFLGWFGIVGPVEEVRAPTGLRRRSTSAANIRSGQTVLLG